jgi:hypothetical protein
MNNFVYMVLNADIPVIYTGLVIYIRVKCVTRHSVKRAVLQGTSVLIVVRAFIPVKCVVKHLLNRAV